MAHGVMFSIAELLAFGCISKNELRRYYRHTTAEQVKRHVYFL